MNRAPDTRLSETLMRLSPAQRKALVGAVSKRFLHEAAGTGPVATTGVDSPEPAAEPVLYKLDEVPTGEVIKDGRGNPAFEKTDAGWKSVIKVPLERILMLVKDANKKVIGDMLKTAGEGEDLTILLSFLADQEDANTAKGLRLKKVDGMFMDPVSIAPDKIKLIADQLKYQPPAKDSAPEKTAKVELGPDDRVFNNIIFKYVADKKLLKVIVDLDKGGTAQLKRLLGTDAAVSKADEEIAKAPTSGPSEMTLMSPVKGSTLFALTEKPIKLKDPVFRYLPGKKLLVLDVPGVDQTLWETLAQKLEVGKKGETGGAGLTISDLRSMTTDQIVADKAGKKFGFKFYANEMGVFGPEYEITTEPNNTIRFTNADDKIITPDKIKALKDKSLIIAQETDAAGAPTSNSPDRARIYKGKIQMVYDYEEFLGILSALTGNAPFSIKDPEEEI